MPSVLPVVANVRGLAQAGLTYAADDPNENMIPIGEKDAGSSTARFAAYAFGGKGGRGYLGQTNYNNSEWGGNQRMNAAKRPLNGVIYKGGLPGAATVSGGGGWGGAQQDWSRDANLDLGLYHCPADKKFPGFHFAGWRDSKLSSYDYFGTSYAANTMFVYDPAAPAFLFTNAIYNRPLSRVPTPANTVAYWENSARFASKADDESMEDQVEEDCVDRKTEAQGYIARGWHGEPWHFNVAMGDGHASWVKIRGFARATGIPTLLDCGNENARCICVIIRGNGWQLDTLPAPFVKTAKTGSSSGGGRSDTSSGSDGASEYDIVP